MYLHMYIYKPALFVVKYEFVWNEVYLAYILPTGGLFVSRPRGRWDVVPAAPGERLEPHPTGPEVQYY